jgi:hypothetical protein
MPGGSNGTRVRLWKWELQQLANRTGLTITTCHFPPGDEQVEHDRASPLLVYQSQLAGAADGDACGDRQSDWSHADDHGLRVRCELDRGTYPKGRAVSDAQLAALRLTPNRFHGDWNYTIHPIRHR